MRVRAGRELVGDQKTKYFQTEISQPRSCTTAGPGPQCLVALQAISGDRDSKRLVVISNLSFIRMEGWTLVLEAGTGE